jgi:cytochrome c biogenesis protein CcdA
VISGQIALAFSAGMIAAFNPCGFALLPAYLGAFVSGDGPKQRRSDRVLRSLRVSGAVSAGFVAVFSVVGLIIDSIASTLRQQLPWVTIVIGSLLVAGGLFAAAGRSLRLRLPGIDRSLGRSGSGAMFGYGVTFAVASLSCTIGPFLVVTGAAVSSSWIERIGAYVAYSLGMGAIIAVLSLAAALAHQTVATNLRRFSRIAPRIGGVLMILAGGYAIWYGRWELAVYDGRLESDGVVETGENIRSWFISTIDGLGASRIGAGLVVAVLAVFVLDRVTRGARAQPESSESQTTS